MNLIRHKSLITLLGLTTAAMLGGFAGCSSSSGDDSSNPADGGPGDDGSTGDGSPQGDGSTPTDGGTDSGPTAQSTGYVTFSQSNVSVTYSDNAIAGFYVLPAGYDADCAGYGTITAPTAASTSCTIKVCTNPISPTDGGTTPTDAGAVTAPNTGNITLLSTLDTAGVVITAGNDGTYTPATGITQWWTAGDTAIEVKSAGSSTSIPAFDNTGLIGPGDPTAPTIGGTNVALTGSPAFDRGTDLAVTYSGGTASTKVYLSLTTTSTAQKSLLSCSFDAANGEQTVKSADLEMLQQAGQTGITGAYTLQGRTSKATTAGDFNFNVVLNSNAHAGTFTNTN
ncbi:MAG: hypothetical protein ABI421_20195 [Polyangiaceae bacterium]